MKKLSLILVATTLMGLSATTMADDRGWKHEGWKENGWRSHGWDHRDKDDHDDWREERREDRQERRLDQRERWYNAGWRAGRYGRGDRLPYEYRKARYYVNDWRAYRLYQPPRGYRWMRINNDFLLVSLANYLIYGTR